MKAVRRFAVTLVGAAVVILGVVLMPLPGPGLLIVAVGLAILATEYAWARRLLARTRAKAQEAQQTAVASP
ncbi:MAG: PGPGW domain-containing protein, partial [Actinobacteria bacterium]|nr:PGPGW domain-containing protein [Actinomycetota bacterium]